MEWTRALEIWLRAIELSNPDTAQMYRHALHDFLFWAVAGMDPEGLETVESADVIDWVDDMIERNIPQATIAVRCQALASFFQFCIATYTDADDLHLATVNPVDGAASVIKQQLGKTASSESPCLHWMGGEGDHPLAFARII